MLDKPITIVDIETTGMSARTCRIIEIGIIKIHDGSVIEEFSSLINPGTYIPKQITALTGIKSADLEDQPYFEDIAPKIDELFSRSYFMAHNVLFDFSFIKRQMEACGYSFSPRLLCSVKLSRALYKEHRSHSLENIINRHGIEFSARHRALDDALAVHQFINIACKEKGEDTVVAALKKQLQYKSLPSNFDDSFLAEIENTPGVYVFKDSKGTPIYIGKSKTLRKRILSHFSAASALDKEMKISQQTHKLEVINTDSDLEALLLESRMVKEQLPIYNRQLRRKSSHVLLVREQTADGYDQIKTLSSAEIDTSNLGNIMGVYDNRTKSKHALQTARDTFDLCSKLIGLEKTNKACFYYQLGRCKGACIGSEKTISYNLRSDIAFQRTKLESWKYKGPILLRLSQLKALVIENWTIIESVSWTDDGEQTIERAEYPFDVDTYKILRAFIKLHPQNVLPISPESLLQG